MTFVRFGKLLCVGLCLGFAVGADTRPYVTATAAASTPAEGPPFPISVDVTVENRGQLDSSAGTLELTVRPAVPSTSRPKSDTPTMWDPVIQSQPVPALKPGERKVLHFGTQYQRNAAFKNRTGSFKAVNIAPAGADVTVVMTTVLR